MTYATTDDLIDRFGDRELLGAAGTGDRASRQLDQDRIDQALADADATIDAYLARRFEVPVVPTPQRLKALACDLARYTLRNRNEGGGTTSDAVRDRYKDAIAELDKIASGKIVLDGAIPREGQTAGRTLYRPVRPLFADGGPGLKGW